MYPLSFLFRLHPQSVILAGPYVRFLTCLIISGFFWALMSGQSLAQGEASAIRAIEIQGLQHIEPQAILGKLSVKTGDPLNREEIRKDIQQIYSLGFFEEVEVATEC